jgi:hypothetical protein
MDVMSGSRPAGHAFGQKMFRKWWDRACKNLEIVGVDLYGGARHSTHQYLRQCGKTPEEIQRLSMHSTSKAAMRYLEIQLDELRTGYALTERKKKVTNIKRRKAPRA